MQSGQRVRESQNEALVTTRHSYSDACCQRQHLAQLVRGRCVAPSILELVCRNDGLKVPNTPILSEKLRAARQTAVALHALWGAVAYRL